VVHGAFLAKHAVAGARAGSGALLSMQHSNIRRFGPKKRIVQQLHLRMFVTSLRWPFACT